MQVTSGIASSIASGIASGIAPLIAVCAIACGGSLHATESEPVVTVFPDDFVLRDIRKAAAPRLNCQVGMIDVAMGPWAGSSGDIIARGCGYQITYYVACRTSHMCDLSVAD